MQAFAGLGLVVGVLQLTGGHDVRREGFHQPVSSLYSTDWESQYHTDLATRAARRRARRQTPGGLGSGGAMPHFDSLVFNGSQWVKVMSQQEPSGAMERPTAASQKPAALQAIEAKVLAIEEKFSQHKARGPRAKERAAVKAEANADAVSVRAPDAARALGRDCAEGCHVHGNCNRELGRCDCPPLRTGAACEKNAVPLCATQWGLELPYPACQVWTLNLHEYSDFPVTCECLAECQHLNLRVEYAKGCVNTTRHALEPDSAKPAQGIPYPWHDRFSDGKWMQQVHTDRVQLRGEDAVRRADDELAQRLREDGRASKANPRLCSGRGLFTAHVPFLGRDHAGGRKFCHCFPGWFGESCEVGPGHPSAPDVKRQCVHGCSGRGVCKLNWCHCVPGTWGIDCSEGEPSAADADAAARAQRTAALAAVPAGHPTVLGRQDDAHAPGLWGWPAAMAAAAAPPTSSSAATRSRVRIYVYDLPPRFNAWLAAHFKFSSTNRWDDSWLYSLDLAIHRWLLRSPYRTKDPERADFFLVPAYVSLGFYDFEFGLYWLSGRGFSFVREAFEYVKATWPYAACLPLPAAPPPSPPLPPPPSPPPPPSTAVAGTGTRARARTTSS